MEFLSYTAFKEGVTKSIMKDMEFTHWLPLCTFKISILLTIVVINEEHYTRASPMMKQWISLIVTDRDDRFAPDLAVDVLAKLMNTMVVDIMSGHLHGNTLYNLKNEILS
jgi:hypothetical protein